MEREGLFQERLTGRVPVAPAPARRNATAAHKAAVFLGGGRVGAIGLALATAALTGANGLAHLFV